MSHLENNLLVLDLMRVQFGDIGCIWIKPGLLLKMYLTNSHMNFHSWLWYRGGLWFEKFMLRFLVHSPVPKLVTEIYWILISASVIYSISVCHFKFEHINIQHTPIRTALLVIILVKDLSATSNLPFLSLVTSIMIRKWY